MNFRCPNQIFDFSMPKKFNQVLLGFLRKFMLHFDQQIPQS